MKKVLYLCLLITICLDAMAQFDPNDKNWDTVFIDDFSGHRYWNTVTFEEGSHSDNRRWECRASEWTSGVTLGDKKHHAYQPSQAVFCGNGGMNLIAKHISDNPLLCNIGYQIPSGYSCDPNAEPIYYFSGMIETLNIDCHYGYYEMRCRMPVHLGVKNSFWLYGSGNNTCYEEIDIFEHSEENYAGNINRRFSCGLWRNPYSTQHHWTYNYGKKKYHIPDSRPDLTHDHVFGLEWMPDKVSWFLDGELINEYSIGDSIPKHPMRLKIDYQIMSEALDSEGKPVLRSTDTMNISYVKVYKLKTDCNTDVSITTSSQFTNFDPKVKRSISIGSPNTTITVPSTTAVTMRAVEGITIDGEFELPQDARMTLIVQECPE